MTVISDLILSVQKKFNSGEFDKYIHELCFPKFKSFSLNTKIEFNFPIAVLVGPNGGGKSSILQAAWGMPHKHSTSRFWFSTPVDPIDFDEKDQHRYWYSHYVKSLKTKVQCRKMSGNKRHGYWEPTRPSQREGMSPMPTKTAVNAAYMSPSGDRWTQVERTPYYFNSKSESSAFDRFFNSTTLNSLDARQDYFVKYSKKLKEVIDFNLTTLDYYGVERVSANYMLSASQLTAVNKILQKKYVSAKFISHKFYDKHTFSPSVIFETSARSYSECFAGSGELAVVNFVLALEEIEEYDLLLLDEPETSLHPGAQEKLLEHLLEIVNQKKIQVIISTHSPTFVQLLPNSALIVLEETPSGVMPRANPTKSSAFARLGAIDKEKITILTEDILLKAVVDRAVTHISKHLRDKVTVVAADLGVSEMLSNQVRAHVHSKAKLIMVLDGDQQDVKVVFDHDPSDISLKKKIELLAKLKAANISVIGSKDEFNSWMEWCKENVMLINQVCPEQILLELLDSSNKLLLKPDASNSDFKSAVRKVLYSRKNDVTPEAQYHILKLKLGEIETGSIYESILDLSKRIENRLSLFE